MKSDRISKKTFVSDDEIVRLALKGDSNAQKAFFNLFAGKMMTVCRRYARDTHEAEDFMQESFIKIFRYLHQYRGQGSLEGWIRKTVVNTILRSIQKRSKHDYMELTHAYHQIPIEAGIIEAIENEEILSIIAQLPEGYKIIFNLYVMEGFTHKEIGEILEISESTSRSQLVRAKASLRKSLLKLNKLSANYHGSY